MTVFLRNGTPAGTGLTINSDLTAHHIQYSDLVSVDDDTNDYPLTMEVTSTGVRIYTYYTVNIKEIEITLKCYLCDEGNTNEWAVMKTIEQVDNVSGIDWTVYTLNESTTDGALGANTKAKYTKEGKYYTTMYSYFPYQLLDGVKAYYLPMTADSYDEETNNVIFTEITGNVPAYTAVVLECNDIQNENGVYTNVKNRILPLPEDAIPESDHINPSVNLLKGYISLNGSTTANNQTLMYVLSSKRDELGFYHSTSATMSANKAYLELPQSVDDIPQAKTATFSFGQPFEDIDTPTNIKLSEEVVGDEDEPVFDLNGRKVAEGKDAEKLLRQGIYVKKGKKFVVK